MLHARGGAVVGRGGPLRDRGLSQPDRPQPRRAGGQTDTRPTRPRPPRVPAA